MKQDTLAKIGRALFLRKQGLSEQEIARRMLLSRQWVNELLWRSDEDASLGIATQALEMARRRYPSLYWKMVRVEEERQRAAEFNERKRQEWARDWAYIQEAPKIQVARTARLLELGYVFRNGRMVKPDEALTA